MKAIHSSLFVRLVVVASLSALSQGEERMPLLRGGEGNGPEEHRGLFGFWPVAPPSVDDFLHTDLLNLVGVGAGFRYLVHKDGSLVETQLPEIEDFGDGPFGGRALHFEPGYSWRWALHKSSGNDCPGNHGSCYRIQDILYRRWLSVETQEPTEGSTVPSYGIGLSGGSQRPEQFWILEQNNQDGTYPHCSGSRVCTTITSASVDGLRLVVAEGDRLELKTVGPNTGNLGTAQVWQMLRG